MNQRVFSSDDQLAFAELSGDLNPLHLDPLLARRLVFGQQVVHGLHALLWSLDVHFKSQARPAELLTAKANFQAGIGLGEPVRCRITARDEGRAEIQLETDNGLSGWFEFAWRPAGEKRADALPGPPSQPEKCRQRSIETMAAASGEVFLYLDVDLAGRLFPNLMRVLPPMQIGALLATTRLVGMECPGYDSIFASLNLTFFADPAVASNLTYQVASCNQRLGLVAMDVEAPGTQGQVNTFMRPKPQRQATFAEASRRVEPEEFSGQRALIVGGSRGLGEAAAKLLAAGGAEVILTYFRGEQDAQRIVAEVDAHRANATCMPLNVLEPLQGLTDWLASSSKPLYLYYFATSFIFGASKGNFSPQRFATFSKYYVSGFLRTVQALANPAIGLKKVFYPSSAAIDELPADMAEYAAAKAAGEVVCDFLQQTNPGLVIHKPRLPRLATDQTVSLLPVNNQAPGPVILENLRLLKRMKPNDLDRTTRNELLRRQQDTK